MKTKALLGFLFAMVCAAVGFVWGRHKREADRRAEEGAAPALPPPVVVSTSALEVPPDLPSDERSGDSVPRGLE